MRICRASTCAVAALWDQDAVEWKMSYGANIGKFAGNLPWVIITANDGSLGSAQQREIAFLNQLNPASCQSARRMTVAQYQASKLVEARDGAKWSRDWDPLAMCMGSNGSVFIITGKSGKARLRHASPQNRDGQWWSQDWSPSAVSADGKGGLFVITNGNLRHVTSANKDGQVWSRGWNPSGVCTDGGDGLFVITNGNLRHVTAANRNGEVWSKEWNPSGLCADGNGGVFIVSNGNLRHCYQTAAVSP